MFRAVSCWLRTTDAQVFVQVSPCGICCAHSGIGTSFLQVLWFSHVIYLLLLHIRSHMFWVTDNGPFTVAFPLRHSLPNQTVKEQ